MKDEKMNNQTKYCQVCGEKLIFVPHVEYDGMGGSYEPYYDCPNGCEYPTEKRIDTTTEYGKVIPENVTGERVL